MRTPAPLLVATTALSLTLTACTPTTPPTPTPAPTFQCTPEAGGTPFTCTERQHQDMKARDQDYTEAEAVYRKLHVEIVKMYRAGGYTELPPEMSALLAGTAHQDYLKLTTEVKQSNSRSVAGEFKIPWIRRLVGASKEGSELALLVCTDATGTTTRTPGWTVPALVEGGAYSAGS